MRLALSNPFVKFAVGAAALPLLPARLVWMRAQQAVQRATDDGLSNAADALAREAGEMLAFEVQVRELETAQLVRV